MSERPDPMGELYLYGGDAYRARIDAEPERVADRARAAATAERKANECQEPVEGWAPPGEVCRCHAPVISGAGRCARHTTTFFAVIDSGAHDGHVTSRSGPAWPTEGGWTYQDVTGAHGTVLAEGPDRAEVQAALDAWLANCPVGVGERCYTMTTAIGPWEPCPNADPRISTPTTWQRKDARGRACAMVSAPGDADAGRYGWFAMNEAGESRGNLTAGEKAPSLHAAMALADQALHALVRLTT